MKISKIATLQRITVNHPSMIGLHRGYSEDAVETDDLMISPASSPLPKSKRGAQPARPPRKISLTRGDDLPRISVRMDNGKTIILSYNYRRDSHTHTAKYNFQVGYQPPQQVN